MRAGELLTKDVHQYKEEPVFIEASDIAGSAFPEFLTAIPSELGVGMELEPKVVEFPVASFALQHRAAEGESGGTGKVLEKAFVEVAFKEGA